MKKDITEPLRARFAEIDPQNTKWRKQQLMALSSMLKENHTRFLSALQQDLGKGKTESKMTELSLVAGEISAALKNLDRWAKPEKVSVPLPLQPGRAKIMPEPYGVVLIIGAWNYPVNLTLCPLVSAIAAANAAVIKPSEHAPASSALLAELLPRYLDTRAFCVVTGGAEETTQLLAEKFDRIFYTGGRKVGEIVMKAAAEHMTPVTMELGGKSPCVVDETADIHLAARRIVFAKFLNAGQTCIAPDYVLADKRIAGELADAFKEAVIRLYGENPQKSKDYGRIVNRAHFDRLTNLMQGQTVFHGGRNDPEDLYIEPSIITNVDPDTDLMQQEIFGPLLPIVPVENISAAFNFIVGRDKPLAFYMFSRDSATIKQAQKISAGAVSINDAAVHAGVPGLPFGGVGGSGFGQYHGKNGFDEFSHKKAIWHGSAIDFPVRYPPYSLLKRAALKLLLK